MLHGLGSLLSLLLSFVLGMISTFFVLAFTFSVFQGIARTWEGHCRVVGPLATLGRTWLLIKLYLTVTYALRHAELVHPSVLLDYHGYRLECVINYLTPHNDAMIIYIRAKVPKTRDHCRVLAVSNLLLQLPNWANPNAFQWASEEEVVHPDQIIMAISNPDEIKRWGIIPMVIALSVLNMNTACP